MTTVLSLLLFFLAAFGLLSYLGYGLAAVLAPQDGRKNLLLTPLLGYCALVVASSAVTLFTDFLTMRHVAWGLLAGATALNIYTVRRRGGVTAWPPTEEDVSVLVLSVAPYALGSLPLIHVGSTAFVGLQWDLEIYLPLTEYLKRYPMGAGLEAPSNPLVSMLNSPAVRGGSGWGFSYFDAFMGTVLGWPSHLSFRPGLLFILSMSVPSVYLFCRRAIDCSSAAGFLTAALWAINGLALWIASIGLAGHATAFLALPLALATAIWALRRPGWRTSLLAGLTGATLFLSFYTAAAPFYLLPLACLALHAVLRDPRTSQVKLALLSMAGSLVALALPGHLRFLQLLPTYFRHGLSEGWHVQTFSPLGEALGLVPYEVVTNRVPLSTYLGGRATEVATQIGSTLPWALVGLGLVATLKMSAQRATLFLVLLPFVLVLLTLRFSGYPYGYFKGQSLTAFFAVFLVGLGLASLWQARRPWRAATRAAAVLLGLAIVPLLLANTLLSLRFFQEADPAEVPRSTWEWSAMAMALPTEARVYVMGLPGVVARNGWDPRVVGMLSYFLLDHPIVGRVATSYGAIDTLAPGAPYDYAVSLAEDNPMERGFTAGDAVWRNQLLALYRVPDQRVASLELEGMGKRVVIEQNKPLAITLKPQEALLWGDAYAFAIPYKKMGATMRPELSLLNFAPQNVVIETARDRQSLGLPLGLVRLALPSSSAPYDVRIHWESPLPGPVVLSLQLDMVAADRAQATQVPNVLAASLSSEVSSRQAKLQLTQVKADSRRSEVIVAVEVYERKAYVGVPVPTLSWELRRSRENTPAARTVTVDLLAGQCREGSAGAPSPPPLASSAGLRDADYDGWLVFYNAGYKVFSLPWFSFRLQQGQIVKSEELLWQPYALVHLSPDATERTLPPRLLCQS